MRDVDSSEDEVLESDADLMPPPPPGPMGGDVVLVALSMVGSLAFLIGAIVVVKDISVLDGELSTLRAKAAICEKIAGPPVPSGAASVPGKPGHAPTATVAVSATAPTAPVATEGTTIRIPDGKEPPLLVELNAFELKGGTRYVQLGSPEVLPSDQVTVMNLWATWCKPCLHELPELRRVFEGKASTWSKRVRFLPILTQDQATVEVAYRDHQATMPPFKHFLVEFGGFTESLEQKDMWRENLPVTMIVGCRQRVRWLRFGELREVELNELKSEVDKLVEELGTPACRQLVRCGDGECNGLENKLTCAKDCPKDVQKCGDHVCDGNEASTCTRDCTCGDRVCGGWETSGNCPKDCKPKCVDELGFPCKL